MREYKTVKGLLSNEDRWCTVDYARDKDGYAVGPRTRGAVAWCLVGAINKIYRGKDAANAKKKVKAIIGNSFGDIEDFNDHPGIAHYKIMDVIKRAKI